MRKSKRHSPEAEPDAPEQIPFAGSQMSVTSADRAVSGTPVEKSSVKVLLVDRFVPFHQCLRDVLTPETGFEVVATAEDSVQAFEKIAATNPDVVLVDAGLFRPDQHDLPELRRLNGVETARLVRARYPHLIVVLLATEDHEEYYRAAAGLHLGGFLPKRKIKDHLVPLLKELISKRAGGTTAD